MNNLSQWWFGLSGPKKQAVQAAQRKFGLSKTDVFESISLGILVWEWNARWRLVESK